MPAITEKTTTFSPNHWTDFTRDDGTVVEIAAKLNCEGRGLGYYVTDCVATLPDGTTVELTESEFDRFNEHVCETVTSSDMGYD